MRFIIGCDFHPSYQQMAMLDTQSGEVMERSLAHENKEEVRKFYAGLPAPACVGIEATGGSQWFERMLVELGHVMWIGDAAKIRLMENRKQKTDRRDALLLLDLLRQGRFPCIWVPTPAERDARQLLLHRHKWVRLRTQVKNQLQAMAMNQGVRKKSKLWSVAGRAELEALTLPSPPGFAAAARRAAARDSGSGSRCGRASGRTARSAAADDASGSGTGDGVGLRVDHGTGEALSARQASGQLSGIDSQRALQRRAAAVGTHLETGERVSARVAGGSGAIGGAVRAGDASRIPAAGTEEVPCGGQGGYGAEVGSAVVLDAARRKRLCAAGPGSCAGQPESSRGRSVRPFV